MPAIGSGSCGSPEPAGDRAGRPAIPSGGATSSEPSAFPSREAWGTAGPVRLDPDRERAFVGAELARDPDASAVVAGLDDGDPKVSARAAWALARIGGEPALRRLLRVFDARAGREFPYAALALLEPPSGLRGETTTQAGPWAVLEDRLWMRYAVTDDGADAQALLLAIARTGGVRSMDRLAVDLGAASARTERSRFNAGMEAAGILCVRGHALPDAGVEVVAEALTALDPAIRASAAYALGRCAAVSAEALAGVRQVLADRLVAMVTSAREPQTRLAWYALAGLGEAPAAARRFWQETTDRQWRTEVEAVRALATVVEGRRALAERLGTLGPDGGYVLLQGLRSLWPHVAVEPALIEALAPLDRRFADTAATEGDIGIAYLRCLLVAVRATAAGRPGDLDGLGSCAEGSALEPWVPDALAVEALVHMGEGAGAPAVARLLGLARDARPQVAAAALSAFADLDGEGVAPVLRAALARTDVGVVAAAAGALAARAADESRRDPEAFEALAGAATSLANGVAVEARVAAIEALGRLARADPSVRTGLADVLVPLARDPSAAVRAVARAALAVDVKAQARFDAEPPGERRAAFPAWLDAVGGEPGAAGLRIHTDRGAFVVDFAGASAPLNQANVARLARSGHFDGLTWHRVVPGFVVQGGDPRGDGYGGAGHLIPCEWSNLRYGRGTVGVPLAGKDTGGGQLFVTQGPQPHLDGRYTVIGQVIEGLEVLDRLLPHDRITRVEVLPVAP